MKTNCFQSVLKTEIQQKIFSGEFSKIFLKFLSSVQITEKERQIQPKIIFSEDVQKCYLYIASSEERKLKNATANVDLIIRYHRGTTTNKQ